MSAFLMEYYFLFCFHFKFPEFSLSFSTKMKLYDISLTGKVTFIFTEFSLFSLQSEPAKV